MKTPDFLQPCKHVTLLGSERLMNLDIHLDIVLNGKCTLTPLAYTNKDNLIFCFILFWSVLSLKKKSQEEKATGKFAEDGICYLRNITLLILLRTEATSGYNSLWSQFANIFCFVVNQHD